MFVEGIPIWEQLIYWAIMISVFIAGLIVLLGFLFIHVIEPLTRYIGELKKIWKEETNKGRNKEDDIC